MIPTIGLIVAIYAITRLVQVPLENTGGKWRWGVLLLISAPAVIAIALLGWGLIVASMEGQTGTPSW
jgi:hypothetical protein